MNTNEENLQNQMESGKPASGLDAHAYQIVFNELRKEPTYSLSADFAQNVVNKIVFADQKKESKSDLFFLSFGIFFIAVALVVAVALTSFKLDFGIFSFISGYKGLLLFAAAFIAFLNWLDKRLIGKQTSF
jgi:hypothetical protein